MDLYELAATNDEEVCYKARVVLGAAYSDWSPLRCVTPTEDPLPPTLSVDVARCLFAQFVEFTLNAEDPARPGGSIGRLIDLGSDPTGVAEYRVLFGDWIGGDTPLASAWSPFSANLSLPRFSFEMGRVWAQVRDGAGNESAPVEVAPEDCGCEPEPDFDGDGIGDVCDDNSVVADAGNDQVVECEGDGLATVTLDGSGSGAPMGEVDFAWTAPVALDDATSDMPMGVFPLGSHTVDLVVSQDSKMAENSVIVHVVDTTPPEVVAPPTVIAATCGAVSIGTATASDSCSDEVVITNDAPATFFAGITVVTWRATDASGNFSEDFQVVSVDLGDDPSCCPPDANKIEGTSNNDFLTGTSGRDCILGYGAQDEIHGGGGDDIISGGHGDDLLEGGSGRDFVEGGSGQDIISGGDGDDSLRGGDGDDEIFAGDGNDVLSGGQGQDELHGGEGNDEIFGDIGDDTLFGEQGDDLLNGGGLHDICDGGPGNNMLLLCENQPDSFCVPEPYEVEHMEKSTGGAVPDGWNIWSNGYVAFDHDFPGGPLTLSLVARGQQAFGVWPQARIVVGGQVRDQFFVNSSAWATYPVEVDVVAGTHEVRIEFTNDVAMGGQDRNLYVDKVIVDCAESDPCLDGQLSAGETSTDCGGPQCAPCANGGDCNVDGDCQSGLCDGGVCQAGLSQYSFESDTMGWTNTSAPVTTTTSSSYRAYEGVSLVGGLDQRRWGSDGLGRAGRVATCEQHDHDARLRSE